MACPIGYALWKGDGASSVRELEERFARACMEVDFTLGEPAAVRHFLNWVDDNPLDEVRRLLLIEVLWALVTRALTPAPAVA
jgi:hypothetical protein